MLPTFDAIRDAVGFDLIVPRHEQGGGHMAEGYARATGDPGVILVTSGPGVCNTVTALHDAYKDGIPLVAISGQVPTNALGSDAFQEADVVNIFKSCTKWATMITDVNDIPRCIEEAFKVATTGRPGPVLVDFPKDVSTAVLETPAMLPYSALSTTSETPVDVLTRDLRMKKYQRAIKRSAALINQAKKPVIYAGHGVESSPHASVAMRRLADKACIPVTTTLLGLGAFDEYDPKALHMLGMHGSVYANKAMQEADLIIALGARFDDRVTGDVSRFCPGAYAAEAEGRGGIIHFDINPKHINRVVRVTEAIEGDVQAGLLSLLPHVATVESRPDWLGQIDIWKQQSPFFSEDTHRHSTEKGKIDPQIVMSRLSGMTRQVRDKTIITTGVGQHQMWAAQHYRWTHPRSMITSGGAGTMGYGLPAAIGAKVARPEALVIDVDGDASFSMSMPELSTAVEYGIGVKILLFNNEEQGMVTQWQSVLHENRQVHNTRQNPDFVALAKAMGVEARMLLKTDEIDSSLQWLLDVEGPALLEVKTERNVPVYPMVAPGKALDDMIIGD